MNSQYEYYEQQAHECMEMARTHPIERTPWLELAAKWRKMIPDDYGQAYDRFSSRTPYV
jgi:hypothetical protein